MSPGNPLRGNGCRTFGGAFRASPAGLGQLIANSSVTEQSLILMARPIPPCGEMPYLPIACSLSCHDIVSPRPPVTACQFTVGVRRQLMIAMLWNPLLLVCSATTTVPVRSTCEIPFGARGAGRPTHHRRSTHHRKDESDRPHTSWVATPPDDGDRAAGRRSSLDAAQRPGHRPDTRPRRPNDRSAGNANSHDDHIRPGRHRSFRITHRR